MVSKMDGGSGRRQAKKATNARMRKQYEEEE